MKGKASAGAGSWSTYHELSCQNAASLLLSTRNVFANPTTQRRGTLKVRISWRDRSMEQAFGQERWMR